jgi:hypothetical protein
VHYGKIVERTAKGLIFARLDKPEIGVLCKKMMNVCVGIKVMFEILQSARTRCGSSPIGMLSVSLTPSSSP